MKPAEFLRVFDEAVDLPELRRFARALWNIESTFCYRDFARSARFCADGLRRAGARDVQRLPLKADGRSVYGDFVMPKAWDVDAARLEIVTPPGVKDAVLADLRLSRFAVANRCGPTPPEGIEGEVVRVESASRLPDLAGKFAFVDTLYPASIREGVVRGGGIGIISAFSPAADRPDGIHWINGWGAGPGWYQTAEEIPLPCFSISPATGIRLRRLLADSDRVRVRARVDSRLYNGMIHNVTGLLPGRRREEILLIAHMYEPLLTDNATAVAALVQICRTLRELTSTKRLPPLERGIRFLFTMERYGTAAYFAEPRPGIVAAINFDSISPDPVKTGCRALRLKFSPCSCPFAGDDLLQQFIQDAFPDHLPLRRERADFADDTIVSGPGTRIPSVYLSSSPGQWHHNSIDPEMVDWEVTRRIARVLAGYAVALARDDTVAEIKSLMTPRIKAGVTDMTRRLGEALALADGEWSAGFPAEAAGFVVDYAREKCASLSRFGVRGMSGQGKLLDWVRTEVAPLAEFQPKKAPRETDTTATRRAANLIPGAPSVYPFCLHRVPREKRIPLPADYDAVLNWADGKRDLKRILDRVECERILSGNPGLSLSERCALLRTVELLARNGYFSVRYRETVTRAKIVRALRRLGIRRGDALAVHVSLSSMGHVEGGARTVCEALMEGVGEQGTLTLPSFNHDFPFRPGGEGFYSPRTTPTRDGAVAECFRKLPGVHRSLNPTHPFCVWGKHAEEDVRDHHRGLTMGHGSPLERLERRDGKIVLIGVEHANTFHHVVEMTRHVPCLGKRTEAYPVKLPSGHIVECRTWGWRNGGCPITDSGVYWREMKRRGLVRVDRIGTAEAYGLTMRDCRRIIEGYLDGTVDGYPGCQGCGVRPRKVSRTVPSDWDVERQAPDPETTAFLAPFPPFGNDIGKMPDAGNDTV